MANSIFQTPTKRSMGNKRVFLRKYKSMYYFKCYNCTTLKLLNITYSIVRFWLIQVATPKSSSFVMKLNLYTTFNEQFIKYRMETCLFTVFNGTQARLLVKLLGNNLLCRPKRLMNCFSHIKITCGSVYLLFSLFLALVCLKSSRVNYRSHSAMISMKAHAVCNMKSRQVDQIPPTPPIWCQIPHPNNNH